LELVVKLAWGLLGLLHLPPAAVLASPGLVRRLYGVAPEGDIGLLLTHRGALFLAVAVGCVFAVFDPGSRRLAALIATISMAGFLVLYGQAGWPPGPLRAIAIADAAALPVLAFAAWAAWRR